MKKRKLKAFVRPMIYGLVFSTLLLTVVTINQNKKEEKDYYTYVNSSIVNKTIPTISEVASEEKIIRPYTSEKVEVYKKYYDNTSNDEDRNNEIIFYNNTYVQNTGTLFKSEEKFDIVSILDGTVIDVKQDETLGNVVSVKHKNNIISTYEGLEEVKVKKDDVIKQGDLIGISGNIKLDNNLKNALLIEITKDGNLVNPENYFEKKLNEI